MPNVLVFKRLSPVVLGQVSSQTLTNLRLIDEAADCLVLRPLITHDKEQIIAMAKKRLVLMILLNQCRNFCGVISKNPTVKAVKAKIEQEEGHFDFSVLESAWCKMRNIWTFVKLQNKRKDVMTVDTVSTLAENDIILDIRSSGRNR